MFICCVVLGAAALFQQMFTLNNIRHFSLWVTLIHCCVALVLVPCAMFGQAWELSGPAFADADRPIFEKLWHLAEIMMDAPPNWIHKFVSGFAGVYYTFDLILMLANVHPLTTLVKVWYTVHHVLCFIGLTFPVFVHNSAWDMDLAYVGFWVGEISNPPRSIVDLLQYQIDIQIPELAESNPNKAKPTRDMKVNIFGRTYSYFTIRRSMDDMIRMNVILFTIFRFVGVHYFVSFLIPYHKFPVTAWMGGTTLALSLTALWPMFQTVRSLETPSSAAVAMQSKKDKKEL